MLYSMSAQDATDDALLTSGDVARLIDRSPSTVQYLTRRGVLQGVRIAGMNRAVLYRPSAVKKLLAKRCPDPDADRG